ncbi:RNA polymerase II-associated protein 3-like [Myxocyprinus asiaticus]|uniref:RNA polymerase II-associated protein 3-like n=1 Tax=Myxocyprinus asiaticus TaxID=70543 RepID=UPI002221B100|nr:RNA polymerase II-associated protein 3-like [Myxocyprinus asiaticus]XP_051546529.1 RNA polymerase II-associated protein 3-like [Myxocyprinus asiaticus]XP_051546530.1 RNA polymerase II-associated protein 3-like [Myxocyprinus asiaticus]XP_051546531.1 RNA polymerase II-associated protein 3-like [Myxocyprinus asiaticus]
MSGNKALDLQLQMRQNAEDLQNYMKELNNWEEEVKRKDQQLRTGNIDETQKTLPPVRNKDHQKTKKRVKRQTNDNNGQKETARIKSYDYQAWDKFAMDKALESMETEESPVQSNESEVDRDLALAEKEKGNELFKDGQYDSAVECYTRGMSADPYNPVLPTNRAACFCRLKKFAVAESDCNLAIALDSKYLKAYARRGAARAALKNHQGALDDYEMVLKLDPGNMEAQNEIKKLKQVFDSSRQTVEERESETAAASAQTLDPFKQQQLQEQHRKQEAVIQKDRGNAYFKEGKYEAAVECYTKGIEADDTNALLPANRAMAYLKLNRYSEAEQDCSTAVALDDKYSKAFARRATARASLGKIRDAREDFEQVLKLEPGNKQAINEIEKLTVELRASGLLFPDENTQRRTVQPINKPEHLRSTKPLRRIDIQEVGGEMMLSAKPEEVSTPPSVLSSPSHKIQKIEEISDAVSPPAHRSSQQDVSKESVSSEDLKQVPPPPNNSFQLESDLRKISRHPESTYRYLKQISPDCYPKIFQNSLEPDILNLLLKTFHSFYIEHEDASLVLAVLRNLTSVGRFDMAVMFMSSAERKVVQELFDWIRRAGLTDRSVQDLQKKYGL